MQYFQKMMKNKLPKWFNGHLYNKGEIVTNPFSGFTYYLDHTELSMYDFIMGAQFVLEIRGYDEKLIKDLQKGIDWFREHNSKAYMVLLD